MAESAEELKNLLMKVKEGSENAGLKLNIEKTKIMASNPVTSWQRDGESGNCQISFSWAPESLRMVTAAREVKSRLFLASLVAQMVKNLPAVWETQVQSLGWEDPLEKGMAAHSSMLAWKIPWTDEPGRLQSTGSQRIGHD